MIFTHIYNNFLQLGQYFYKYTEQLPVCFIIIGRVV